MTKLMIASPCYSGKVDVPFAVSLAETTCLLLNNKIPVQFNLTSSGSLLIAERNRIIQAFMESDCTHLLCVDSDIGWQAHNVTAMLLANVELIAGVYPSRGENSFTFRPQMNPDNSIAMNEKKLLKMDYIPAGFMMISRSAIEKMQKAHANLYFEPKNEALKAQKGFCLFNCEVWEGEFWGEDYYFCRKAREAGVEILVDPTIVFNHAGKIGRLLDALSDKPDQVAPVAPAA